MREYPAGDDALLLDFSGDDDPAESSARVANALRVATRDGRLDLADIVACAETVLVESLPGVGVNELGVRRVVHEVAATGGQIGDTEPDPVKIDPVMIDTVYDGPDLAAAATLADCSTDELIRAHTEIRWRVQFMGFAPGFGYLVPDRASAEADVALLARIGRRKQSRATVPPGSVAVAAGYSAVYPRESPGGWQLLGRTDRRMWDSAANPPAVLSAGGVVRFTAVTR